MSFPDMATVDCSTKRADIVAGKRGAATEELTGLKCTPLDPVDAELSARAGLSTPIEVWQTFIEDDNDIQNGDILVVGNDEYTIRAVWDYSAWDGLDNEDAVWDWLILEEVKSS